MMQAYAIRPRVVRVPTSLPENASLLCRAQGAPAVPLTVVAVRQTAEFIEVVFDAAMTPRATYRLHLAEPGAARWGAVFQGYVPATMAGRSLDLWSLLPRYNRRIDATGDLRRFMGCLQDAVDALTARADAMPRALDMENAPTHQLGLILSDLGNPFVFDLSDQDARRLGTLLIEIYRQKGTARGITNAIRLFLGLEAQIDCHIVTRDAGGIRLGGAAPASVYAFDVVFGQPLTEQQRERVKTLVAYLKPAHTHLVDVLASGPASTTA